MDIKRILFIIMCVLLVLTITLTVIMATRISGMLQGSTTNPPATQGTSADTQGTDAPTEATQAPTDFTAPTDNPGTTDPNHEHNMVKYSTQSPSCDKYGWTVYKCSCGKTTTGDFRDPYGHTYGSSIVVAPTCAQVGYTTSTCSKCGHVEKHNIVDALGHDFSVVKSATEATCTEAGQIVHGCANRGCDQTQTTAISALNHDFSIEKESQSATCTEDGYAVHQCANEGCEETQRTELTATGHDFSNWTDNGADSSVTCGNEGCDVTILESALTIQQNKNSTDTDCIHYIIVVGTDAFPELYTYEVLYYLQTEPSFTYQAGSGLIVTYDGGEQTLPAHTDHVCTIGEASDPNGQSTEEE